ncbi:ATP-binding protein [Streptomyces sp. NPDC001340]
MATGGIDRPGRTSASSLPTAGAPICVIAVVDQGPELSAEEAERVFERFYRVDPSRSRAHGGLAIATAITQGHGGRAELDIGPGKGCVFCLALPWSTTRLDPSEKERPTLHRVLSGARGDQSCLPRVHRSQLSESATIWEVILMSPGSARSTGCIVAGQ